MGRQGYIAVTVTVLLIAVLIGASAIRGSLEVRSAGSRIDGTLPGGPVEGSVFLLVEEGDTHYLAALDARDAAFRGTIPLPTRPSAVVPTPGGVSVFVAYPDRSDIDVFDTITLEQQERLSPEVGAVEALSFAPDGSRLYVVTDGGRGLHTFAHQRLSLEPVREDFFEESAPGGDAPQEDASREGARVRSTARDDAPPVLANRRATHIYRPDRAGLTVLFAASGDPIDRIDVDARHWRFDADRTALWGVHREGYPVRVTERAGEVTEFSDVDIEPHPPAVVNGSAWYLGAGGDHLIRPDGATIPLPHRAVLLVETGDRRLWAIDAAGMVVIVPVDISNERERLESLPPVDGTQRVLHAVAAIVQQEGNFACF